MSTPQEQWASYREKVMPKQAGPVQVLECKRAFVAGMMIGHTLTCNSCEAENEDDAVDGLESLNQQLQIMGTELGT